ncbi:MAG: Ig-like domain-containing protein, partial [Bacteroidia bacterium]
YNVYAIATDDDLNNTTSATIQFTAKIPPTVSISAPLDATIYPSPQTITLSANATDADGTVDSVEFFVNGASVGTVNAAPWQIAYVIPAPGTYDVYAIVIDDDANSTTSATIQFSVPFTNPIVSIIAPLDGTIYPSPQVVNITANATDPNGTISNVRFYANGVSIGTVFFSPWQINLNVPVGTYDVYAIATDNQLNSTTSDTIQFVVNSSQVNMVEIQIDQDDDDGIEKKDGKVELDKDWIEMAEKGGQDFVMAAYRFRNIPLGPEVAIDSAFLVFQSRGSDDRDPINLMVYGEDNINAAGFTDTEGDLSERPRTKTLVPWIPNAWPTANIEHQSADLAPLVQEMIDVHGWTSGNAMAFFIAGEGKRAAYSYDKDNSRAAKLRIYYRNLFPTPNTAPEIEFANQDSSILRIDFAPIALPVIVSDSTGGINQVVFTINGSPLSSDAIYPFESSYTPTSNGIYEIIATVTDDGGLTAMDTLLIEVDNTIPIQTISLQISQDEGDGEEDSTGMMELNDQSIQLLKEKNAGEQLVAFNFGAAGIPAGAEIVEAYIQFTSKEKNQNYHPIDINIQGEYDASSSLLQNVNFDISNRARTQALVNWQPLIWIVADTQGERQRTPDLSKVVEEMANHPAWSPTSPLTFIFSGMGGRPLHSFDSDPAEAAELVVKYKLGPPLSRGPYLQSGSDTSIVLRFQTAANETSEIFYGNSLGSLTQSISNTTPSQEHTFQINSLTPDTRYFYEIRIGGQNLLPAANERYWQTAPVAGVVDTVRAWVLGDAGTSNTDARTVRNAYQSLMGNRHTDMILMLGDNAYMDGTQDDYQTAVFEDMYEDLLSRTVLWTSPGEREFANGYTDSNTESGPYFDIFNLPRNAEAGGIASGTEAYYSYDYSNVHFVSLDVFGSDVSPAGSMLSWLQTDLAATTQDWIVVFFHHSPYSKGAFDSDTTAQMIAVRENILPILETNDVDLVLSAHSQSYERSFLSEGHYQASHSLTDAMLLDKRSGNPNADGPYAKSPTNGQGTVYVVSGSAGKTETGDLDHPIMYKGEATLGSSVLEVFDRTLDFRFIDLTGNVVDQFQIVKGEAPQVALSTPADPMVILAPQNVTLTANATDSDGTVVSVAFAVNGTIVNTDNAAPWTYDWTPAADGIYEIVAIATDDDGIVSYSAPATLFVGTTFSVCIPISSGGNDVEENAAGLMDLRNEALAMIDKNGSQQIGLRFERPNIFPGASITDAYIQYTADTIQTASTLLFFEVENAFPSAAFSNQANDVSSRSYQTGIVSWNVPAWSNVGDATTDQQTPDLTSQIDQYINNPAYQFNQAITYRVSGSGLRTARAYDQKSGDQAVLCVSFELPLSCFPINDIAAVKLWHKADVGVYEDNGLDEAETGDGVARWQNFAQGGADAQQSISGKRPVYTEPTPRGIFNGSGGMAFGSNRSLLLPDNLTENSYQIILVQRSATAASKQAILASAAGPNAPYIQIYKEGQNYYYSMGTDAQNETILIGSDESAANEYHIIDVKNINNELRATLDATPYFTQSFTSDPLSTGILQQVTLGEDPNDDIADFQGEIAEIFVFDRSLSGVEYGQIMTYLSVKYGIKIPFTAHNYYSYGTHDDRLFGIGQNLDDRCLQKTNSRSVMPDNRVRFYNPSDLDEGEFLISGDDDASTAVPSIQVPNSFQIRLARTYRVRETGDVGTINLDFDMAGLGADLSQPGRYFVLIDDDGDFSDAQVGNTSLASLSGTILSFSDIDFT